MTGGVAGLRCRYLDPAGRIQRSLDPSETRDIVRGGRGELWVDIDSRDETAWALLQDVFAFHPLAIEDTRSPDCRVKVEEYEGYLFIVVRAVHFATWTPEPYDIESVNLYLFLGPNYLVTVHAGRSEPVEEVASRVDAGPEPMQRGAGHLAYVVLDTLVDLYFPLLDEVDDFVEELEEIIITEAGQETLQRVFELKRMLLALRRHLAPAREVMGTLANRPCPYLRPATQIYLRDVYDHVIRQVEAIDLYRELMATALETNLTAMSNRMNEVIKALSVIATVVLPPTLVASVYGMNFRAIPLAEHPHGFWIALAAMFAISAAFLVYAYRKRWL